MKKDINSRRNNSQEHVHPSTQNSSMQTTSKQSRNKKQNLSQLRKEKLEIGSRCTFTSLNQSLEKSSFRQTLTQHNKDKGQDAYAYNTPIEFFPEIEKNREGIGFQTKSLYPFSQRAGQQLIELVGSSSHFGRPSRDLDFDFPWHASQCSKFSGVRNQVPHTSGLQTLQCLAEAFYCIALVLRKGGKVLVVNKNIEFSPLFHANNLRRESKHQNRPATACSRWVGGCLTNWKELSKSAATLLYFSNRFGLFLKHHNIHFPRFKKMEASFQGFIDMQRKAVLLQSAPQLLFLFHVQESQEILDEATRLQIPVVALTDSSCDFSQITYPIPINSDSAKVVHKCLSQFMLLIDRHGGFSK